MQKQIANIIISKIQIGKTITNGNHQRLLSFDEDDDDVGWTLIEEESIPNELLFLAEFIKEVWMSDEDNEPLTIKLESTRILPSLKLFIVNDWKLLFKEDLT